MKTYLLKHPGEVVGTLRILGVARYQANAPVYRVQCLECQSESCIPHFQFTYGTARCISSICGKVRITPATSSGGQTASRSDGWSEWRAAQQPGREPQPPIQEQKPTPPPDPEKKKRDDEYLEGIYRAAGRAGISLNIGKR
jgi:hypothetical protein